MKKLYFLLTLLISTSVSFGQTEVFNASGSDTFASLGWSGTNNVTTNDIERGTYYLVDAGSPADIIETDVYDLTAYGTAEFSLTVASFGSGDHNQATIDISYDGGATYTQNEVSTTTTGSSYIDGGTFTLTSALTNQVKIRISNNGTIGRGVRLRGLVLTGYSSDPILNITSPVNGTEFSSGTTSVDVSVSVLNFNVANGTGDGYIYQTLTTPGGVFNEDKYDTTDQSISVADGESYTIRMQLVDNSGMALTPDVFQEISFSVAYPCDLQMDYGSIATVCDATTAGVDTYTTTIDFTGGGTSTYTIDTGGNGTITGDDPSSMASGTIQIDGVGEDTDFAIEITGDVSDSSCDITVNISAPVCVTASCAAAGSIIITEIMQNPSASGNDPAGEYFEVYNTTGSSIDLEGWLISDAGSNSHVIESSVVVLAGGYVVIGNVSTTTPTLDYNYGNDHSLANGDDEIILTCSGAIIDEVYYDGGPNFPDPTGISMELALNQYNSTSNDVGANWGESTGSIGNGDSGTPGVANSITSLSVTQNEIEGFAIYPNPVTDEFTINSFSNSERNVQIYNVLGKQVYAKTVLANETINVANLNTGIYILKVLEDGKTATRKLVIR